MRKRRGENTDLGGCLDLLEALGIRQVGVHLLGELGVRDLLLLIDDGLNLLDHMPLQERRGELAGHLDVSLQNSKWLIDHPNVRHYQHQLLTREASSLTARMSAKIEEAST